MTRLRAYIRLLRWYRIKKRLAKLSIIENEDEITDFEGSPYLGWMEDEWNNGTLPY